MSSCWAHNLLRRSPWASKWHCSALWYNLRIFAPNTEEEQNLRISTSFWASRHHAGDCAEQGLHAHGCPIALVNVFFRNCRVGLAKEFVMQIFQMKAASPYFSSHLLGFYYDCEIKITFNISIFWPLWLRQVTQLFPILIAILPPVGAGFGPRNATDIPRCHSHHMLFSKRFKGVQHHISLIHVYFQWISIKLKEIGVSSWNLLIRCLSELKARCWSSSQKSCQTHPSQHTGHCQNMQQRATAQNEIPANLGLTWHTWTETAKNPLIQEMSNYSRSWCWQVFSAQDDNRKNKEIGALYLSANQSINGML